MSTQTIHSSEPGRSTARDRRSIPTTVRRPATLVIELSDDSAYVLKADGVSEKGQKVTEKTQTLIPDSQARPVPDFPGLTMTSTRPDPRTLGADLSREDGSLAGQGTDVVSVDGRSMTAITSGFDSQLRQFEQRTNWDKVG